MPQFPSCLRRARCRCFRQFLLERQAPLRMHSTHMKGSYNPKAQKQNIQDTLQKPETAGKNLPRCSSICHCRLIASPEKKEQPLNLTRFPPSTALFWNSCRRREPPQVCAMQEPGCSAWAAPRHFHARRAPQQRMGIFMACRIRLELLTHVHHTRQAANSMQKSHVSPVQTERGD